MPSWMADWPVLAVLLFFLAGAIGRSQAIYWLGRGAAAGVLRTRWSARLDSPQVHRATQAIERWGMPVVPLAFLTVGFQSAVFGATGLLRVGWLRFTLWALPGAVAWALVWGGGGMAAVAGVLAAARQSPWLLAAVLAGAGVVVTLVGAVVRRRRARWSAVEGLAEAQAEKAR